MAIDPESLLAPVADADPAGPDLSYDPQRHEIEQAFEQSVSIDASGVSAPQADVDWSGIIRAIVEQSARTKDIWLAVYLCRAGARAGKLEVVEAGVRYLAGLIEHYWESAHPRLDDYGIEGRVGACDTLASFRAFVGPLRDVVLLDHPRHGSFTGEDLQRFHEGGEQEAGYGAFRATLEEDASVAHLIEAAAQFEIVEQALRDADLALSQRAGVAAATNFAPVYEMLGTVRNAARAFLPRQVTEDDMPTIDRAGERRVASALRSRDDVSSVIDLAIEYYRQNEPHSPVPLLLARAQQWIHRDFLDVLADIVPNAVDDARLLLNFRRADG